MERLPPRRVVILGGGTAGWMAANLLAHYWGAAGTHVTLVESPEIGIIGVGEGSTPQLKHFFDTLGISEAQWMPRCNATYKNGIQFADWSRVAGFSSYFHPFPTGVDSHTAPIFFYNSRARRTGRDVCAHPDRFFLPSYLAAQQRGPIAAENFPFEIGYGYHFDAHLVGAFLRDHAKMLGVAHLERRIVHIEVTPDGKVDFLQTAEGEIIKGELFIDSSGFNAEIIQQALGEPFVSFRDMLFNDRAVVMPTPVSPGGIAAQTRATALSTGWAWDIPLTNRCGNGYVYASDYLSADAAETELRRHLGLLEAATPARHLKMKVGRVNSSWVGNAVAIGLAQGFIEPLEATALHIVQFTVEQLVAAWTTGDRAGFNTDVAARYDGIRDYIVCHYRVNQRTDSDYWRDNAANQNISDSLKAILTCWFTGGDLAEEIEQQDIARYYAPISWHCLLAGYGTFPAAEKLRHPEADITLFDLTKVDRFIQRCGLNFASHTDLLAAQAASAA